MSSFAELIVDGSKEEAGVEIQKAPSSDNLTPSVISLIARTRAMGMDRLLIV